MRNRWFRVAAGVGVCSAMISISPAQAEPLVDAVKSILVQHERLLAAMADYEMGKERVDESFANSWFPLLNLTVNKGYERQMNKPTDTEFSFGEVDIKLTQRLFDWGKASSDLQVAELTRDQYDQTVELQRQAIIQEAVSAFYNLRRTALMVEYAGKSEANVLKQTEVENVRVSLGQGYSTDVLMAKSQLAGAQARRVQYEGAKSQSENRAANVFRRPSKEVMKLDGPKGIPVKLIPAKLDEAVDVAIKNNPQLLVMNTLANLSQAVVKSTTIEKFGPLFNFVLEQKNKTDVAAVDGFQRETVGKVEVAFPFNLGFSSLNSIRAVEKGLEAARKRYDDTRFTVEEQTRNAWHNYDTATKNAFLLEQSANLTAKFLEQAREERKLGKRTLLDLLSSETAWINALSDAASAKTDTVIAFYTLLQSMGQLNLESLHAAHASTGGAGVKRTQDNPREVEKGGGGAPEKKNSDPAPAPARAPDKAG